ncbi:nuclear transport factor 2 family protein [Rhodovarius crocodyli]|uniref:Nuclear transport factor 2 family protein n=1 Tax=Rhodovarius crocodyli TaxID=1979269 RepID=A0A437MCF9_9PROT|nr:nuclear transport factor 2 family protein [Rhodovarius crocodyli]RVT95322.1 nuclear transport factor 2 family protein [Rhodovarius crocodyli]
MTQSGRRTALIAAAGAALLPAAAQAAGDETAVNEAVEAFRAALKDGNRARLDALVAPELSYGHSSARIENKQQFLDNATAGTSPFNSLTLPNQTVAVVGDSAIARHHFVAEQMVRGAPVNIRIGVLQVWQKQSGRWLLLARQAFALPAA